MANHFPYKKDQAGSIPAAPIPFSIKQLSLEIEMSHYDEQLSFFLFRNKGKKRPIESLMASLHLAKKCHPSLKQFFVSQLLRC